MSIFRMHGLVIDEYRKYVQSFLSISDERIRTFIQEKILDQDTLWPDALIQLNPSYQPGPTVEELVQQGRLHPTLGDIFRTNRNQSFLLYHHQIEAIERALKHEPFIVTSGTGSGKSFTYFIPIFNAAIQGSTNENKVWAIIVYPMNALVNSQYEALEQLASGYKARTGKELPIRFAKYTGQERDEKRNIIQRNPPHILLTNYVMLELMLVRPEEHNFVDRTTTGLKFLAIDELHTYRGRQGADVSLLIRRLRERCGNPDLLCVGTSATMVAGKATSSQERRQAVAEFAGKLFGVSVPVSNVIEESLQRITSSPGMPDAKDLQEAVNAPLPETPKEMINNPLTTWIELTFGIEQEEDGQLRRRIPISLGEGAKRLSEITGMTPETCQEYLRRMFIKGSQIKRPDGTPLFAFKLHQFIGQGRTVYATIEAAGERFLSMDGQYYAPEGKSERVLYPLIFCRICGQEYYKLVMHEENSQLLPEEGNEDISDDSLKIGYLNLASGNPETDWTPEHIPAEWLDSNGKIKRNYRQHIPLPLWVTPDGSFSSDEVEGAFKGWFQPRPFMLCLNCGEFYSRRDKVDFRKLTGLSSEGRSTATTVLSISALQHAREGGIEGPARKVLSFTDNRQDASLQAGHFNDFVYVSILRAAIYAALEQYGQLSFDDISARLVASLGLSIKDIAENTKLESNTREGRDVWSTFYDLIEYRIYEDLRRGWRIIQPNLEQCGLLRIDYKGLDDLYNNDASWESLPSLRITPPENRKKIILAVLDHFRKNLAINVPCLKETVQQQLKRIVQQRINNRWRFDENEGLRTASIFILPGQPRELPEGLSLAENSLIGRYLRRSLDIDDPYPDFIDKLLNILCSHGLIREGVERGIKFVQLDASALIWQKGVGTTPPLDPIYSRRATSPVYADVQRKANEFFRDFYRHSAGSLRGIEGHEHTAQISYESRIRYENLFREGRLSSLFCSPTMELGIDIADLQLVHLRNVPPTPANYAQRSGRAGRKGSPALVFTYCAGGSGHDQYFFKHREEMVSGVVRPPRIDLANEDLVKAHVHAVWLAKVRISLGSSMTEILELSLDNYPLKENIAAQANLSEDRFRECLEEAKRILLTCFPDLSVSGWFTEEWLMDVLRNTPDEFDRAFNRWRELYKVADSQWIEATEVLRYPSRDREKRVRAEAQRREAERQKHLLCNIETTREESDFYPYRYLASEGFLPGYNFPRLPVRAYVPREDGEFISRPRFLALAEFGPQNIVYHEGTKYIAGKLIPPPGGIQSRRRLSKICKTCGYFQSDTAIDLCENCCTRMDGSNSEILPLLEMPNVKTWRRERITCDEEERRRIGYEVTTHFRFAPGQGGEKRTIEGTVHDSGDNPLFHLLFAPSASLYRINHGWRNRREKGFILDMENGEWLSRIEIGEEEAPASAHQPAVVRLFVQDTQNILLLYFLNEEHRNDEALQATIQYALKRGIEEVFQIEESEIISERIGSGDHRAILFWEAAEGGVGVLRRLVEDRDAMAQVALAAIERCHFDPATMEDKKGDCICACYECLLSYYNQRDYPRLNRHLIKDLLARMNKSLTHLHYAERDYEAHYRWLRSLTDSRSELERRFIDLIYQTRRRLPDDAQRPLSDYASIPDFYYEPNVCVFCDGSVHDEAEQREKDITIRHELKDKGYRVVVIRYDRDMEEQIRQYEDIFGEGRG